MVQNNQFIDDISQILTQYYQDMNATFLLGNSPDFLAEEIFNPEDLLILFLYDKQKYLTWFCRQEISNHAFVELIYENQDSLNTCTNYNSRYVFVNISSKHNLTHSDDYLTILKFLTTLIVTDPLLKLPLSRTMDLNVLYSRFVEDCKSKKFNILSTPKSTEE